MATIRYSSWGSGSPTYSTSGNASVGGGSKGTAVNRSSSSSGGSSRGGRGGSSSTTTYYVNPNTGTKTYRVDGSDPGGDYIKVSASEYSQATPSSIKSKDIGSDKFMSAYAAAKRDEKAQAIERSVNRQYSQGHVQVWKPVYTPQTFKTQQITEGVRQPSTQKVSTTPRYGLPYKGERGYYQSPQERAEAQYRKEAPIRASIFLTGEHLIDKSMNKRKVRYNPYVSATLGLGAGLLGLAKSAAHPVRTIKGIGSFGKAVATQPKSTFETISSKAATHMEKKGFAYVGGEIAGYYIGGKAIGKGVTEVTKRSPVKLTAESLKVPTKKGETTLWRGVGLEVKGKGRPLIGVKGYRPTVGTPKVDLSKAKGEFVVEGSASTKIVLKNLKSATKTPDEALKLKYGVDVMSKTYNVKSRYIQREFIKDTKTLSPKGVQEVIRFTKGEKGQLYGSFPARQQMPITHSRVPGDIDVFINKGQGYTVAQTQKLASRLRKAGETVRVSKSTPTLIETKVGGKWHHAVDIHSADMGATDVLSPSYAANKAYGFPLNQKSLKIEGVRVMPLSEQGVRKGASAFTIKPEKGGLVLTPKAHRMKDVADFFTVQETLLASKKVPSVKGVYSLSRLKKLYPGVTESQNVKIPIGDFAPKPPSPSLPIAKPSPSLSVGKSKVSTINIGSPSLNKPIQKVKSSPSPPKVKSPSKWVSVGLNKKAPSPSIGLKRSVGRSVSKSPSRSPSRSLSKAIIEDYSPPFQPPSKSPSLPLRRSKSPSPSPSPSRSLSPSASLSPSPSLGSPSTSISPSPTKIPKSLFSPPPSFSKDRLFKSTKKLFDRRVKQPVQYTPDAYSIVGGVRGKKPSKGSIKTGLGIRPIIGKKKTKNKKTLLGGI